MSAGPRKVLCSLAIGPHRELLDLGRPALERYAARHGYDVVVAERSLAPERPVSWSKVLLLRELVDDHDLVLWIDADAILVDDRHDLAHELHRPAQRLHLAVHRYAGQVVPNAGVVAIRGGRWSARFLERVWAMTHHVDHRWWENAAILELLGYHPHEPVVRRARSRLHLRFGELDVAWNSVPVHWTPSARIVHFAGCTHEQRLAGMRALARHAPVDDVMRAIGAAAGAVVG